MLLLSVSMLTLGPVLLGQAALSVAMAQVLLLLEATW